MSALGRYFIMKGIPVAGYDRLSTNLTAKLEAEGMKIHYADDPSLIPAEFSDPEKTLVIYTPAIPENHTEFNYFKKNKFKIYKRSAILGEIVKNGKGIAVAGTHGKTTISGMIAHILHESGIGCNAFLGGISLNYNSNYIINPASDLYVVEADEFDRSFLSLNPQIALITAVDADHLDIYGDHENLKNSFSLFASQIKKDGVLIIRKGTGLSKPQGIRILEYSMYEPADYYAYNIKQEKLTYCFSLHTPEGDFHNIRTGILGRINIENSVAAFAVAREAGADVKGIIHAIKTYRGINRRFDMKINTGKLVYIDDYAHHPEELKAIISSVKELFPGKPITGIFQPHLYTRTRDFASGFAKSLSLLDNVILLDIYPAREEPIKGISSELIFRELFNKGKRIMCKKNELTGEVLRLEPEVLLSMGAGDIDQMVEPLTIILEEHFS